ncbi:MAG: hypothetical protein KF832_15925 [Caldilineaceae bacterium]|nr:hypothetical protein [Caldilineaceae bacterium]
MGLTKQIRDFYRQVVGWQAEPLAVDDYEDFVMAHRRQPTLRRDPRSSRGRSNLDGIGQLTLCKSALGVPNALLHKVETAVSDGGLDRYSAIEGG